MKILLIEDDESIIETMQMYFWHRNDVEYEVATDTADARNMVTKERYDLILLDLLLKDGISEGLIGFIKNRWADPPRICIMSAMNRAQEIAKEHGLPILFKPFPIEDMDNLLDSI